MVTSADPHNVNNVLYVRRINYEIHFSWQVQYLVKLYFFFKYKMCLQDATSKVSEAAGAK